MVTLGTTAKIVGLGLLVGTGFALIPLIAGILSLPAVGALFGATAGAGVISVATAAGVLALTLTAVLFTVTGLVIVAYVRWVQQKLANDGVDKQVIKKHLSHTVGRLMGVKAIEKQRSIIGGNKDIRQIDDKTHYMMDESDVEKSSEAEDAEYLRLSNKLKQLQS